MPSPGSSRDGEKGANFACFLCEADGFTVLGMQQHIWLFHKEECGEETRSPLSCAFCSFTSSSGSDVQDHINKEHAAQTFSDSSPRPDHKTDGQTHSPLRMPETPAGVDDDDDVAMGSDSLETSSPSRVDVDDGISAGSDSLETSLRLNDCPGEEDLENYDDDVDISGDVEGSSDERGGDDGAPKDKSNLSAILGSVQDTDHPQQWRSRSSDVAGTVTLTQHGGARPKVRPSPPPGFSEWPQAGSQFPASGSTIISGDRKGTVYSCPFCSFHTRSDGEINTHVSQQHLGEEQGEATGSDAGLIFLYSCPFCGSGFDTPRDLSEHINAYHPDGESRGRSTSEQWGERPGPSSQATAQGCEGAESASDMQCPVCGVVMRDGNEASLAAHVNQHFAASSDSFVPQANSDKDLQMALELQKEEESRLHQKNKKFKEIQTQYGMDSSTTAKQQFEKDLEQAAFKGEITTSEFHSKKVAQAQSSRSGVDDGSTKVSGVLGRLRQLYDSRGCPRSVTRAYLCDNTHHYSGSYGDRGWGCGYRNLQMMMSCLMNDATYLLVLFAGQAKIPSIPKLQQLIEAAWQKGFDPQGCQQLGGALVNSRKWIGATEIVALLSSLRIKCQLMDFVKPSGPNNTHPVMIQWVRDYFSSSSFRPPLYLQHQGHSRTIVGVEELTNGGTNLLLFDPGVDKARMEQFHGVITYKLLQTIRKTANAFRAKQYQIVAVVGVLDDQQYQQSKRIRSQRKS